MRTIGDVCLFGGIGTFIIGGIINSSKANKDNIVIKYDYDGNPYPVTDTNVSKGSSTPLIIGLVFTAVSIPLKISGKKDIRESVKRYNENRISFKEKLDVNIIANNQGVGFSLKF